MKRLIVALALAATACSGGGEPEPEPTPTGRALPAPSASVDPVDAQYKKIAADQLPRVRSAVALMQGENGCPNYTLSDPSCGAVSGAYSAAQNVAAAYRRQALPPSNKLYLPPPPTHRTSPTPPASSDPGDNVVIPVYNETVTSVDTMINEYETWVLCRTAKPPATPCPDTQWPELYVAAVHLQWALEAWSK